MISWSSLRQFLKINLAIGVNRGRPVPFAAQAVFDAPDLGHWYQPVILGSGTLGALATSPACLRQVIQIVERLEPDDYLRYLLTYYRTGLGRFGETWRYADIVTVLLAAAQLVQPQRYLEIGVRRGRSMAVVAATCPQCEIVGFDLWMPDYGGIPNPGPDLVRSEIEKVGHTGRLELISGNSHKTVPRYLSQHPDMFFDLITVDGDHSRPGAEQDLWHVLPKLKVGGVIVFDDICHPTHPHLSRVWRRVVATDPNFTTWEFDELGYGVAFGIRQK